MPIQGLASYQIQDADGEVASFDLNFVNTSNLLVDIILFLTTNVSPSLDLVTDGAIRKLRLSLTIALPTGVKANPIAGAENERTGLFTCRAANTPNSYSVDVPAFSAAGYTKGAINSLASGVQPFEDLLTGPYNSCYVTDKYGNELMAVKKARKTFRKHRKALARA